MTRLKRVRSLALPPNAGAEPFIPVSNRLSLCDQGAPELVVWLARAD
jgi:hypothetical protein